MSTLNKHNYEDLDEAIIEDLSGTVGITINGMYILVYQPRSHLFETLGKTIKQIRTQQRSHLHDQATGYIVDTLSNDKTHDFSIGVSGRETALENCIVLIDINLIDNTLTVKKRTSTEGEHPESVYTFDSAVEAVYNETD